MVDEGEVTTSSTMASQLVSCNFAPKPKSSPDWLALAHLWSAVLSGIQQPHDIAAVRAACKTLQDYMDEHVKTLSITQLKRISHQWARNLQSLAVSCDSDLSLLALCTNLQSLYLKSTPASATALSTLSCLTSLELTPSQWDSLDLLSTCTRLQHLQLSGLKECWLHHLDISALQTLTNLSSLHMLAEKCSCPGHSESPTSPLSNLLHVQHLNIRAASIDDVMPLRHLTLLTSLVIRKTRVSSLLPLSRCALLVHLDCSWCWRLASVAGLEACPRLRDLLIDGSFQIADLSALSACSALTHLDAADTSVIDIRAVAACTDMVRLNLSSTQVTDISVVSSFSNLRTMLFYHTPVIDIRPLAACTHLEHLEMFGCHTTDLSPLSSLSSLTAFKYGDREPLPAGSAALDLQPLRSCQQLKEVALHGKRVHNIHLVQFGTQLVKLQLALTKVRHLKSIHAHPSLSSIHLHSCPIRSLQPLAACANLQTVHIITLKIRSLDGLQHCAKLETIKVLNCPVRDIGVLSSCHNLQTLNINRCPLSNIKALAACRKLQHLSLARTQVKTILALQHCTALQSVDISNTRVRDATPMDTFPHLKTLTITEGCLYHISMASTSPQIQVIPNSKSESWGSEMLAPGLFGCILLIKLISMWIKQEPPLDPFAWLVLLLAMGVGYLFLDLRLVQFMLVLGASSCQLVVVILSAECAPVRGTIICYWLIVVAIKLVRAVKLLLGHP